ncbi:GspH/FimT family pseudopilin [Aquisalimonas asiatica]|uniref:Type II secretion system protein H n=1 Tax=Aquisalimonas asiatica TaxID=406100 RepID=A0A1H8S372_9GAMM|nr:GspH/FimT family pseudopilin [Aquisalimonas asiatica]SEO72986.1 type IV fimbrial biogenesis protein FimT [Aquisalimonas asiatica]
MERQSHSGFTLVELLIVLAVAAILFGVAIPSFTGLIEHERSEASLNDLRTGLHQAREYAIRNGMQVTACRSTDGSACLAGERWSEGWIVFEDPANRRDCNAETDGRCDHGGRVLSISPGLDTGAYITTNQFVSDTVRFSPLGDARASNGTFTACNAEGEVLRGMVLAFSGRMRVARDGENNAC